MTGFKFCRVSGSRSYFPNYEGFLILNRAVWTSLYWPKSWRIWKSFKGFKEGEKLERLTSPRGTLVEGDFGVRESM